MSKGFKTFALIALFFILSTSLVILISLPWLVSNSLTERVATNLEPHDPQNYGLIAKPLSLTTEDNLRIQAWEVPIEDPLGVVIFLGGLNNPSVTHFWGHAQQFASWGYASLLIEMREVVSFGYKEPLDVLAGLDYLQSQGVYDNLPIIAFGVDLGGVTAINSAGLYPKIAGVISIGAFSSWEELFTDNLYFSGAPLLLALAEKPFVKLYTLAKFGWTLRDMKPQKQITKLGQRPALVIHSRHDEQVSVLNLERLQLVAPKHVQFWVRESAEHLVCKDFLQPRKDPEYMQYLGDFLQENFTLKPLH